MCMEGTEQLDREAQAHMAIVFLALTEIYCGALGPDSLSHTEPPHPTSKEKVSNFKVCCSHEFIRC